MAVQDLNGQFGAELKEDFLYASAAATDKVIFQLFANGSIVLTKKGGTAPGASEDQIDISAGEKYTVNLTLADIEKLSAYSNLTYKLYRWELLYQMPYDPVIFTGDITLLDRESVPLLDAVKNPRNIYNLTGTDVETLSELNALSFAWQTGDMVTLGTDKTLYRYNGTAFELVNDIPTNPNVGGLLQALVLLATGDNAGILTGANLDGANLAGATLEGANLTGANLIDANLTGANLDSANLMDATLLDATLAGANLTNATLTNANLDNANLDGANLAGANLEGATLTGANLIDANLTGANLWGATLPTNADTKSEFKAVVGAGNWDAVTTIWVDGNPIGA